MLHSGHLSQGLGSAVLRLFRKGFGVQPVLVRMPALEKGFSDRQEEDMVVRGVSFSIFIGNIPAAAAGNLDVPLIAYIHNVWRTADGLPEDPVQTIAQTPDGYLWLGTQEGLARFDGVRL